MPEARPTEMFICTYRCVERPDGTEGGRIAVTRSEIDDRGIHPAQPYLEVATDGFDSDLIDPALAPHGLVRIYSTQHPVGHGKDFFFGFHAERL